MTLPQFTVRMLAESPHRDCTQISRAGHIVVGMEGCQVEDIVKALAAFERTREVGQQDPARWILHFAGLESEGSGKQMEPWIEIIHDGSLVTECGVFRKLLAARSVTET